MVGIAIVGIEMAGIEMTGRVGDLASRSAMVRLRNGGVTVYATAATDGTMLGRTGLETTGIEG